MHTIIHTDSPSSPAETTSPVEFRKPVYDCQGQAEAVKLVVFVPGVDAAGVSIEAAGPDLLVTARKTRFVRVNWQALHLESSQLDYRLKLRLGRGYAYEEMQAELHEGVLTVTVPRRQTALAAARGRKAA